MTKSFYVIGPEKTPVGEFELEMTGNLPDDVYKKMVKIRAVVKEKFPDLISHEFNRGLVHFYKPRPDKQVKNLITFYSLEKP